ncbi:UBP-type zinc finger domain-containing protein [Georgenia halophila]|uniref:UBP-type zinc finger domain-containing protein n=1 Tax=Georgenia halophila TaxID=620889 RepID=A0ABP8LJT5_9MICO
MTLCTHLDQIDYDSVDPDAEGCEECLAGGGQWVHLRACQRCGHIGCCDSSPGRHARTHVMDTGHPVIRSYEPGESWFYCYPDDLLFELSGAPPAPTHA